MSSLPSSSYSSGHKYEVFLSFRGEDTRKKFTDHLYNALRTKGIVTFRDDPDLKRGEKIAPELFKSIQESWCSVIVLSETYAFSSWCLEELAEIVKQKKEKGHKIFPIFYEVDPSDLRKQTGKVKEAFDSHEERYKDVKDKIGRWRSALKEVSDISGWDSRNKYEAELIKYIVDEIYKVVPPKLTGPTFHSKDFMPSKSSNLTFNKIIKALSTNGVNVIGLYGMPGVGKTTLAREVKKHALEQRLFDKVVMVTMSQTPDISGIQDRIADALPLEFKRKSLEEKAEELWGRLKDEKKILMIIDDVWEEFELQTIGIPFGDEHEGCKILLTMRDERVCDLMNCQDHKFKLEVLSEDEAWALFKQKAALKDDSSDLNDVANDVASECKGLPLAIEIIGKALKGRPKEWWIRANNRFKDSSHLGDKDIRKLYNRLQLSYDYLEEKDVQSCFLLCSLFPEDFEIGFELMVMLSFGFGLFSGSISFEDIRMEIHVALKRLQESGLLLETDGHKSTAYNNEMYVRMHDVIRDFAHWITSRDKAIFMVKDGLTRWPAVRDDFECYTAISFWNININQFPDRLEFPKLKILLFMGKQKMSVPSAFLEGIKAIRVLRLKQVKFSLEVLKFMTNLRTLCLDVCNLENISSLSNVKNLEILELKDTNIFELPEELVTLRALKSLHFSFSGERLGNFPPNRLSRLTSLQELHVRCRNNVNLSELNSLTCLTTLSLKVSAIQCFPDNFVIPKLQRYFIVVGYMYPPDFEGLTIRALRIANFSYSLSAFKELFFNVEKLSLKRVNDKEWLMDTTGDKWSTTTFSNLVELYIERMTCLKELCHGPPPIGFLQKLEDLTINYCEKLKVVFPVYGHLAKEEISLSNLTALVLISLPELECIWKLQSTHPYNASLPSLSKVIIRHCNKLKSIFSTCVAQSLLNLQYLEIHYCNGLEQVFDFPEEMAELEVRPLSNLTSLDLKHLEELKWIWKGPTHLASLQSLKTMKIEGCWKVGYLLAAPLAQTLVHLEELQMDRCDSLEHIIKEEAENEDEIVSNMDSYSPCWPKLKTLQISYCKSLKHVFPMTLAQGLPYLESIKISHCPQLKQVFNLTKPEKGGYLKQDIVLQRLQILELLYLENFCSFWPKNFVMSLPLKECKVFCCSRLTSTGQVVTALEVCLEDVPLYDSKELLCNAKNVSMKKVMYHKNLVPDVDSEGLNELISLTIKDGKELECLIDTADDQGHVSTGALSNLVELLIQNMSGLKRLCNGPFPKGFLQKLEKLETRDCMELVSLSPIHNLYILSVSNSGQLQEVIQAEEQLFCENQAPLLSNLTSLKLNYLPELKWLWKGHSHYVSLQSLKVAEISYCNRLKYLFSPSLAQSLVTLKKLKIVHCLGLEQVFGYQGELTVEDDQNRLTTFPKLDELKLSRLPSLKSFGPMGYHFRFRSLISLYVGECPNLITSFTKDSEHVVHTITEAPQQVESNVKYSGGFYHNGGGKSL